MTRTMPESAGTGAARAMAGTGAARAMTGMGAARTRATRTGTTGTGTTGMMHKEASFPTEGDQMWIS